MYPYLDSLFCPSSGPSDDDVVGVILIDMMPNLSLMEEQILNDHEATPRFPR